jgi:hypothetical protein
MSPAEDARLLLAIVQRHLRSLRFSLDPAYSEEEARYEQGPFALPASRPHLVNLVERELQRCQQAVAAAQERDADTGP